jgi:glycosyltransferase involved in cell wall biosynthesis
LFVFVGEGAEKDRLKALAADWHLTNVRFFDQQPREQIARFYAACNLGLVTLRSSELFQEVLPSKLFEYLAMERPVLSTVDGEARRLIEEAQGGEYVPPDDVEQMAEAIRRLSQNPAQLVEMGRCGRRFVLEHFNRQALADRYLELLHPLVRLSEPEVTDVKNPRLVRASSPGPN